MSILKTILCALSFVTTVFASEKYDVFKPNRNLMRQLPVVESPDPFGIDRLVSSQNTPFVDEASLVSLRTGQAVNLTDDFTKEKESGSADGTQVSGSDQPSSKLEKTGDDSKSDANSDAGSLKIDEIVLENKAAKEISAAGCCVVQ